MSSSSTPPSTPAISEASPRQIHQWLKSGEAALVDVREPDEHARERIAGARLVPLSSFDPKKALGAARSGQRLVLHCRGGVRSLNAAQQAAPWAGGTALISMAGGLEAWKKEGLPVEVDARVSRVSVMRQVQLVIGAGSLAGSALAWFVHPAFVAIPAFFGAGLLFAGATGTCGLALLLARMPWNRGTACDAPGATGR
jgi:rhodanese-related sulfurtransferase